MAKRWGLILAAALAMAAGQAAAQGCAPGKDLAYICGLPGAPEDLVQVPDSPWIVAGAFYGQGEGKSSGLVLIDPRARTARSAAFTAGKPKAPFTDCAAAPDAAKANFHGLNLRRTGRGKGRLYAVGHGQREAIEVFDVDGSKGEPRFTWVGCVRPAEGAFLNSVAGFADGRIVFTDFLHAPAVQADMMSGKVTGAVYIWTPGKGAEKVANSDLPAPNGVEVTPDGRWLFVAVTATGEVLRWDLKSPSTPPERLKPRPRTDNIRWTPDGRRLLLAGPDQSACKPGQRPCAAPGVVVAMDPVTLKTTPVIAYDADPNLRGLSIGLIAGDTVWLGSPQGDRVGYAKLKP